MTNLANQKLFGNFGGKTRKFGESSVTRQIFLANIHRCIEHVFGIRMH